MEELSSVQKTTDTYKHDVGRPVELRTSRFHSEGGLSITLPTSPASYLQPLAPRGSGLRQGLQQVGSFLNPQVDGLANLLQQDWVDRQSGDQ
jgi:hypothetical protein